MQTQLAASIIATERGQRADDILRACVRCKRGLPLILGSLHLGLERR